MLDGGCSSSSRLAGRPLGGILSPVRRNWLARLKPLDDAAQGRTYRSIFERISLTVDSRIGFTK
jgi:hypothetical protein